MNEPSGPMWFFNSVLIFLTIQTFLLFEIWWLMRDWGSKVNRKLHRIESYVRDTAKSLEHEEEEEVEA